MAALSVKRSIVRESIITVLFNNIFHHIPVKYIRSNAKSRKSLPLVRFHQVSLVDRGVLGNPTREVHSFVDFSLSCIFSYFN